MSDGLQRATLEALCSRAPWTFTAWVDGKGAARGRHQTFTLTATDLRSLYASIAAGGGPGASGVTGPRASRGLQLLRRAGLIRFGGVPRGWRGVSSG